MKCILFLSTVLFASAINAAEYKSAFKNAADSHVFAYFESQKDYICELISTNEVDSLLKAVRISSLYRWRSCDFIVLNQVPPCTLTFVDENLKGKKFRLSRLVNEKGFDFVKSGLFVNASLSFQSKKVFVKPKKLFEFREYNFLESYIMNHSDGCNSISSIVSIPEKGHLIGIPGLSTMLLCIEKDPEKQKLVVEGSDILGGVLTACNYELIGNNLVLVCERGSATYTLQE